jgi:hypothetical protein
MYFKNALPVFSSRPNILYQKKRFLIDNEMEDCKTQKYPLNDEHVDLKENVTFDCPYQELIGPYSFQRAVRDPIFKQSSTNSQYP